MYSENQKRRQRKSRFFFCCELKIFFFCWLCMMKKGGICILLLVFILPLGFAMRSVRCVLYCAKKRNFYFFLSESLNFAFEFAFQWGLFLFYVWTRWIDCFWGKRGVFSFFIIFFINGQMRVRITLLVLLLNRGVVGGGGEGV
jgi:hypothetical protein